MLLYTSTTYTPHTLPTHTYTPHTLTQLVQAKRHAIAEDLQRKRQAKNARELREWEQRYVSRENEVKKREHGERLKELTVSAHVLVCNELSRCAINYVLV